MRPMVISWNWGLKYFTPLKKVLSFFFFIVHYTANSCAKLTFQEDSQVLTDVTIWFCEVVLTSR